MAAEIRTVPELLGHHAAATPDRTALITWRGEEEREALTYAELDAITDRVAAGYRAAGLEPGDRLAILLDNADAGSFYRLLFGAYKASLVPVPINTRLMPPEVTHIVGDAGARVLIAGHALGSVDRGAIGDCECWPLERLAEFEACEDAPPTPPGLDDPADLLYTSGTTGLPKGSAFRHRSLAITAQNIATTLRLAGDDVFQTSTPVFTSTGTHTCPLPVLGAGATLVMEPRFDVERSAQTMVAESTTVFFGVPAMLMLLLEKLPAERRIPRLKSLMYGGSPMPEQILPRLLERFPGAGLWNLYGLTEAGPTGAVLVPEHALDHPGSVGKPVHGTEIVVVDEEGAPCGAEEPGEILMRAPTLMDGYHNMEDPAAQPIVDGWLHTGDIGKLDADGFLYLVDRKKDLIIRGGYNVYPAEIEKVLYDHPDVLEAAVVAIPHDVLGEEACAVIAMRPGAGATPEEIERFASERLADFKRPRRWEYVDALPRSSMGKVLKRELRDRLADGLEASADA